MPSQGDRSAGVANALRRRRSRRVPAGAGCSAGARASRAGLDARTDRSAKPGRRAEDAFKRAGSAGGNAEFGGTEGKTRDWCPYGSDRFAAPRAAAKKRSRSRAWLFGHWLTCSELGAPNAWVLSTTAVSLLTTGVSHVEAPGDARAKPLVPAVALDGVHDAPLFLNREPRARAVVVEHVERVRLRGVVEHDGRVDVAPLAFVRYARDAEPPPEPGVHGRARELPRRDQGSLVLVSPATVYAIRRVPAPAPAVAPAAAAAAATAAPRTRHPPSRHEASTFGEARRDRK